MSENKGLACFGLVVVGIVAIVVSSLMNGYVLSVLWGWFVIPLFGVRAISVPLAIGFSLVVSMLTRQDISSKDEGKDAVQVIVESFVKAVAVPLFYLFCGWVATLFI